MSINDDEFQFAFAQVSYDDYMRDMKKAEEQEMERWRIKFLNIVSWLFGFALLIVHVYLMRACTLVITMDYESEMYATMLWYLLAMVYVIIAHTIVLMLANLKSIKEKITQHFIILFVLWIMSIAVGIVVWGKFIFR